MEKKQYQIGQIIYRAGEEGKEAYRIIKGKVAISKIVKGTPMLLGLSEKDDIFGELSLIAEQPHYFTAQALEATEVEVMTEAEFNRLILHNPQQIVPYLSKLFEGVRSVLETLALETEPLPSSPRETKPTAEPQVLFVTAVSNEARKWTVTLKATNNTTEKKSPQKEIQIAKFPFAIGRSNFPGENDLFASNDFTINDSVPFQVSRSHCALEREGDRFFIRDRGSRLGTIVNGEYLGHHSGKLKSELSSGENSLTLGTDDSKIRYKIILKAEVDPQKEQEIEALKTKIARALADGILSQQEFEEIRADIYADDKVTPAEAALMMSLMEKVARGEVQLGE